MQNNQNMLFLFSRAVVRVLMKFKHPYFGTAFFVSPTLLTVKHNIKECDGGTLENISFSFNLPGRGELKDIRMTSGLSRHEKLQKLK